MRKTRFREGRKASGLTLGQGARLLGVEAVRLSDVELDRAEPGDELLIKMAALYLTTVAWLLGDDPKLSAENLALLDSIDHDSDRATMTEFMGMLSTPELPGYPPRRKARTLDEIRAERDQTVVTAMVDESMPVATKARYVRSQKQTRKHHCHWTGCTEQVPPAMWGCLAHWRRLPKTLRDRIWASYQPGQEVDMTPSETYLQVAGDVQKWIAEQGSVRR